jgi:hypothetical protein
MLGRSCAPPTRLCVPRATVAVAPRVGCSRTRVSGASGPGAVLLSGRNGAPTRGHLAAMHACSVGAERVPCFRTHPRAAGWRRGLAPRGAQTPTGARTTTDLPGGQKGPPATSPQWPVTVGTSTRWHDRVRLTGHRGVSRSDEEAGQWKPTRSRRPSGSWAAMSSSSPAVTASRRVAKTAPACASA